MEYRNYNYYNKKEANARQWWYTPLIPALGKQMWADLCEFEATLVYNGSSRTANATQKNPVLNKQNKTTTIITTRGSALS